MLYSNQQMLEITGETKPRIQYWVLKGLFQPVDQGKGVGTSRRYSEGNLLEILVIQAITQNLPNVDFAKSILAEIRRTNPSFFSQLGDREDSIDKADCILTVLFESVNAIMVYVHDFEDATVCDRTYLSLGLRVYRMDLNFLKNTLRERIKSI